MTTSRFSARWVLTPQGVSQDQTVVMDEDGITVRCVRPHEEGDPKVINGLLMPGLVNAHLHLELAGLPLVPGGTGLVMWVKSLLRCRQEMDQVEGAIDRAIESMVMSGTVAVSDICSGEDYASSLLAAGICGVSQVEHLGMDVLSADWIADAAKECGEIVRGPAGEMVIRPSPHAPYSTRMQIINACLEGTHGAAASIHMSEDPAETEFLHTGSGPFAELLADLSVDWQPYDPPAMTGVNLLKSMNFLNRNVFLVHGVELTDEDMAQLVRSGTFLVLCPRSNLHIGGCLPPVQELMSAGVNLAFGTDSTTSCPDLDVLNEVRVMLRAFPSVSPQDWLQMATSGGADAIKIKGIGRLETGASPGLLLLESDCENLRELLLSAEMSREVLAPARGYFHAGGRT